MQSAWNDRDAEAAIARYQDFGRDVALRVYTTRLLGQDPRLVLHGGGNTSVKTQLSDFNGDTVEVLCVKGSGWDMGTIEPAGLPAVRLAPLIKLRGRERLSDEEMVRLQRANLIDPVAPNPSVEALLHAFIPHKFVDHTHSTAVLALTDQPDGEALCREVYGKRVGYVPYIMPGFGLARAAADVFAADPSVEGLVLVKHGIFSFGADARQAYERMIALVTLAEERLAQNRNPAFVSVGRRGRADRPRRLQPAGRQERRRLEALRARFSRQRCGDEFRQRRGSGALRPGRRGDAGPQHPHQEQAAGRCRA
jgi:rhamnose utilization protein RhaD (predicted bifunctional aldolase and dehydrogenase)